MTTATANRWADNNIVQAWLVLILAIIFGASLAGIQISLGPIIENNKIEETRQKVPELVLSKTATDRELTIEPQMFTVDKGAQKVSYNVFKASQKGATVGWVVKSKGQGYADKIELLLGLGPKAERINGIFILDQKETPGLGNKIVTEEWRSQFIGKKTAAKLTVIKGGGATGNQIDSLTGATISSKAVSSIINSAVADLRDQLAGKDK